MIGEILTGRKCSCVVLSELSMEDFASSMFHVVVSLLLVAFGKQSTELSNALHTPLWSSLSTSGPTTILKLESALASSC